MVLDLYSRRVVEPVDVQTDALCFVLAQANR